MVVVSRARVLHVREVPENGFSGRLDNDFNVSIATPGLTKVRAMPTIIITNNIVITASSLF